MTLVSKAQLVNRYDFPKLMVAPTYGFIILATSLEVPSGKVPDCAPAYRGTVVGYTGESRLWPLGRYDEAWDFESFMEYGGYVTLTQVMK